MPKDWVILMNFMKKSRFFNLTELLNSAKEEGEYWDLLFLNRKFA